jgi:6-phosphogluconate dehydrogenase
MVGGPEEAFRHLEPALTALAPAEGYLYCGRSGAGHFVKMVHNGIEYAMMEALGEGFELLAASEYAEGLDLQKVAHLWNQGSVIRSWLLELAERAFAEDPRLEKIAGYVEDSGEGRWAVQAATELGVAAPGLAGALFKRFLSRQQEAFSNQVIAALRLQFGGHMVAETGETHHRVCGAGAGRTQPATPETEGVPPASGPGGERRGEASE